MHKTRLAILVMLLIASTFAESANSENFPQSPPIREAIVRSAMLDKFSQYVSWPEEGEIKICIHDKEGLFMDSNSYLENQITKKESVFVYLNSYSENKISNCSILYFDSDRIIEFKNVYAFAKKHNIMLIGNSTDFLHMGGMASLVEVDGNIQIELNLSSIKNAGLGISPSLIEISRRVLN